MELPPEQLEKQKVIQEESLEKKLVCISRKVSGVSCWEENQNLQPVWTLRGWTDGP